MIALVQVIILVFLPALPVTSTIPWYEEQIEEIDEEPTLEDIERRMRPRYRIIEIKPEDVPE